MCVDVSNVCDIDQVDLDAETLECNLGVPCRDMTGFYQCVTGGTCKKIVKAPGIHVDTGTPYPYSSRSPAALIGSVGGPDTAEDPGEYITCFIYFICKG